MNFVRKRKGQWKRFLDGKNNVHKTQDQNREESFHGSADETDQSGKIRKFNWRSCKNGRVGCGQILTGVECRTKEL